jgi:hypothetical protein
MAKYHVWVSNVRAHGVVNWSFVEVDADDVVELGQKLPEPGSPNILYLRSKQSRHMLLNVATSHPHGNVWKVYDNLGRPDGG